MKKKKIKRRNPIAYTMITGGLYKSKVINNKKKERQKLALEREMSSYLKYLDDYVDKKTFLNNKDDE